MGTAIALVIAVLVLALLFGKRGTATAAPPHRVPAPAPDAHWDRKPYYVVPAVHPRSADETIAREDAASDARDDLDDGGDICDGS